LWNISSPSKCCRRNPVPRWDAGSVDGYPIGHEQRAFSK
jgi:hypothetical protein